MVKFWENNRAFLSEDIHSSRYICHSNVLILDLSDSSVCVIVVDVMAVLVQFSSVRCAVPVKHYH